MKPAKELAPGIWFHGYNTHLCIKFEEDIPSVAIQPSNPHTKIRLVLFIFYPIRAYGGLRRDETRFWSTVYFGLFSEEAVWLHLLGDDG